MKILMALMVLGLFACDVPPINGGGRDIAISYQADFYTCGEPPNDVLYYCVVGTGPPRQDCVANGTGSTATVPGIC